jgi:hypothetical protein
MVTGQGVFGSWQYKNWDPAVDNGATESFDDFCAALLAPGNGTAPVTIGGAMISQTILNYASLMKTVRPIARLK